MIRARMHHYFVPFRAQSLNLYVNPSQTFDRRPSASVRCCRGDRSPPSPSAVMFRGGGRGGGKGGRGGGGRGGDGGRGGKGGRGGGRFQVSAGCPAASRADCGSQPTLLAGRRRLDSPHPADPLDRRASACGRLTTHPVRSHRQEEGPPEKVEEVGAYMHECEGEMVCKLTNKVRSERSRPRGERAPITRSTRMHTATASAGVQSHPAPPMPLPPPTLPPPPPPPPPPPLADDSVFQRGDLPG